MPSKPSDHGGKRAGAGRLPIKEERMTRTNVMLDEGTIAKAKRLGGGNLSEGLREAVYAHPDDWPAIKALAERMARKRAKLAKQQAG